MSRGRYENPWLEEFVGVVGFFSFFVLVFFLLGYVLRGVAWVLGVGS